MLNKYKFFALIFITLLLVTCNQKKKSNQDKETIIKGTITVLCDETITPIIEDEMFIFADTYGAKIKVVSKSESEIANDLLNQKYAVAFMARELSELEMNAFKEKKITPRLTPFATDAIALIGNKMTNDSLIALKDVIDFMQGKTSSLIKGVVFDNPNSSTVRYFKDICNLKNLPVKGIYSFKTNQEVIKFVAENEGMIGVVGVNWLSQPLPEMNKYIDQITVLQLKGSNDKNFYAPTQENLAKGVYPLARKLYIVNCQGTNGLGMGIASFVAGDIGQRIILKSQLLPHKTPGRKIHIRSKIMNDKK